MTEDQEPGGGVLAAVETVDVEQLPALRDTTSVAAALHQQASQIKVYDAISAQTATALLGQIVAARRHAEAQRLDLTRPLNAVVKKINAAATATMAPLQAIELDLKAKLTVYQREQERLAAEEHARQAIEAERRRQEEAAKRRAAEDAARAEREAATRAAAQAEAASRRLAREQLEREQAGRFTPEATTTTDVHLRREAEHRAQVRRADLAAQAARDREAAAREAEQQAHDAQALPIVAPTPSAPSRLAGGGVTVGVRKRWDYEVVDFEKVPDRFKEIAKGEVRAAIRDGARSVPGLRIFRVDDASVRL